MMKKKPVVKEEPKEKKDSEATDNKENIIQEPNEKEKVTESDAVNDHLVNEGESLEEITDSSDKVVSDEKSMQEKLAEMQDKYIRLSAEFDNYRKRTLREKIDLSKYAGENLLLKILPVMDDFERAVSHMETATDCTAMKNGIDLIYVKFTEFLKQHGLKEIEALNCSFNVDLHDAVAKVPVEDEAQKGKVVDVIQKGYYLHDKIIRHSKVVVGE
jgi:molecular chaperone GrpE